MRAMTLRRTLAALTLAAALAVTVSAQEPAPPDESATWVAKLREAVDTDAGLALTPSEARAMFDAIVALENARVRTVTTDSTDIYVISVSGTVLATLPLPGRPPTED